MVERQARQLLHQLRRTFPQPHHQIPVSSLSSQALAGGAHTAVVTYACTSGHEDYLIFRLKRLNFVPLLNARLAAH